MGFEFFLIELNISLLQNLSDQVNGESKGVIKAESVCTRKQLLIHFGIDLVDQIAQKLHSLIDGTSKPLFLHLNDLDDIILMLHQFRISTGIFSYHCLTDLIEERLLDPQQAAMTGGSAQQAPQYITPAFILGQNTVTDHEGCGTNMVGDHPQGDICLGILVVLNPCNLGNMFHDVLDRIHLKEVIHTL